MTEEYKDKSRDGHSETKGNRDNAQGTSADRAESCIESGQQSRESVSEVSEGRRRFTKAGLLASPVLMSVASRPVLGGGIPCMSNILSGNLSNPLRGQCALGAGGASFWLNDVGPQNWFAETGAIEADTLKDGGAYVEACGDCNDDMGTPLDTTDDKKWKKCKKGTKFSDVFATNGYVTTNNNSMYRILCNHMNNPSSLNTSVRAHFVVLCLNSLYAQQQGQQHILTPPQVVSLWNGAYQDVGSSRQDVIAFIQGTYLG